jgi:RNA polymerase sigma factor (sigma-70 family)
MRNGDSSSPIAILDAHGGWIRRLGRGLARQDSDAEDLVQDAWVAALRRPPGHQQALRAWFGRVLKNRWSNLLRGEARRKAREAQVAATDEAVVPSPDEIGARVGLQRRIGELVETLEQPLREVVYLRYFEDLNSRQIARRIGVPPGTVRWRLKLALDQLRAHLDQEHQGGREKWRAVLLPMLGGPPRGTWGRVHRTPGGRNVPLLWLGVVMVAAVASLVATLRHRAGSGAAGRVDSVPLDPIGGRPLPPSRLPAFAAAAAPTNERCPEPVPSLQQELAQRQGELESRLAPFQLFEKGTPNPEAERNFSAVIDDAVRRGGRCAHTVECRGRVCKVQLLAPQEPPEMVRNCLRFPPETRFTENYLDHHVQASSSGAPDAVIRDAISGQALVRRTTYYRLSSFTGKPTPPDQQQVPALAGGRHRPFPPLPAALTPSCRALAMRLQGELEAAWDRGDSTFFLNDAFRSSAPNPGVVPQVVATISGLVGLVGKSFPFAVECRGSICAVDVKDSRDPVAALPWSCKPFRDRQLCVVDSGKDSWFTRLQHSIDGPGLIADTFPPTHGEFAPPSPAYVRILPITDPSADPRTVACGLSDEVKATAVVDRCERRFADQGRLHLEIRIPKSNALRDDAPSTITVAANGPLGGSPLAGCIVDEVDAIARRTVLPATLARELTFHETLTFPGATAVWLAADPCHGIPRLPMVRP